LDTVGHTRTQLFFTVSKGFVLWFKHKTPLGHEDTVFDHLFSIWIKITFHFKFFFINSSIKKNCVYCVQRGFCSLVKEQNPWTQFKNTVSNCVQERVQLCPSPCFLVEVITFFVLVLTSSVVFVLVDIGIGC